MNLIFNSPTIECKFLLRQKKLPSRGLENNRNPVSRNFSKKHRSRQVGNPIEADNALRSLTWNRLAAALASEERIKPSLYIPSIPYTPAKEVNMCDFEEFLFECGHGIVRFKSNCHFRRNDPNKECYSVKVLRNSWKQDGEVCDSCSQQGIRFDPGTRKLYRDFSMMHG